MARLRWPLLAALLAAVLTIGVALLLPRSAALNFLGVILGAVAGVYLGFAIRDGGRRELAIEVIGLAAFTGLAVVGLAGHPGILAAGFLLHIAWDFAHHPRAIRTQSPSWYPPACLVYDGIVGFFLLWRWS